MTPAGSAAVTLAILAIGWGMPAYAGSQGVLTLSEAIATAQANSLAVQTSKAQLAQAQAAITQTYAGLYPQLSLSESGLSYNQIDSGSFGAGGLGGLGLGGAGGLSSLALAGLASGGSTGPLNTLQTSLSLTQILFDGFQTADALKVADASVQMGQVQVDNQDRAAAYTTARAYFQVLEAQMAERLAAQNVLDSDSHLDDARHKLQAGTGTRFDILQAQAQVASVEGQLRSAQNTLDLARLSLANAMGASIGDRPVDPAAQVQPVQLAASIPLDRYVDGRPEVQTLLLQRRIDEAKVDLAAKANYPHAQVQAQYSQQTFTTGRSFMVDAGLSWPLVDWGKSAAQTRSAQLDLRQVDIQIAQTRRNLATAIQSALYSRQDAQDRVRIAGRGLQSAQEAYRMAQVRYRAGVGTGYEVIDAQSALLQAQNTCVQANYQLQASEIAVAQALAADVHPTSRRKLKGQASR